MFLTKKKDSHCCHDQDGLLSSKEYSESVSRSHGNILRTIDRITTRLHDLGIKTTDLFIPDFYSTNGREFRQYLITELGKQLLDNYIS